MSMDDNKNSGTAGAMVGTLHLGLEASGQRLAEGLGALGLGQAVTLTPVRENTGEWAWQLAVDPGLAAQLAPGHDTQGLLQNAAFYLGDTPQASARETVLALLLGAHPLRFPSVDEWWSAVRVRGHVAEAARRTMLDFRTASAERPESHWTYDEERGFTILPGRSLSEALRRATQPEGERLYSFSCYRATEYVLLLGLAQELAECNPELLARLEQRWQHRAIQSGAFHDVFLVEHGSIEAPLPERHYVPGDRVWFRNPDEASSDASGYEGSWTFYLGGGQFANLWGRERPFTFESKCIEVYHWRDATYRDGGGELRIDESRVAEAVARTEADPERRQHILARMGRLRDPKGVYADGGCVDASRECLRWLHPATSDIRLPPH